MAAVGVMRPLELPSKKRTHHELDLGNSQLSRPTKARRAYYGVDVHRLLEEAQSEDAIDAVQPPAERTDDTPTSGSSLGSSLLWTEKYRARKFTDLIGDERTHRAVMHWLKKWDPIVFASTRQNKTRANGQEMEDTPHKKILLLNGPAGLGKTTLAHVCAKQAGYEVQEINASDERSREVVTGRIKDMVGTENVRCVDNTSSGPGEVRKTAKPICVVVDEVDGAVGGSAATGDGGFVKALIDLVHADQRNSTGLKQLQQAPTQRKKGSRFRLLRPIILVCNDVYHPALRPLRQSSLAEIIHLRKPQLPTLITRVQAIFEREGIAAETDAVRRLCEAVWGVSTRKEDRSSSGAGEGDMRSIMVVGEWVASKLRAVCATASEPARLTRQFIEKHILSDLAHGGGAARGVGRGATKDVVDRVFAEGAGFPKSAALNAVVSSSSGSMGVQGVAEANKRVSVDRLRQLVDTHGDSERVITDSWMAYPTHPFQDDTLLSKPSAAYEWMHFHDSMSKAVFSSNEWELAPYLSTPVLGFHLLFASQTRTWSSAKEQHQGDEESQHPFYTTSAPWAASEALKEHSTTVQALQHGLSLPLSRLYSGSSDIATELLPYTLRMLNPKVVPVIVGGSGKGIGSTAAVRKASEQQLVCRAANAMSAIGVRFEKIKVASADMGPAANNTSFIFRMEPALDQLGEFSTAPKGFGEDTGGKTRYAVRQVLEQEFNVQEAKRAETSRMARFYHGAGTGRDLLLAQADNIVSEKINKLKVARDFFGRPLAEQSQDSGTTTRNNNQPARDAEKRRVWITYHEGFSNAVRKPLTLAELMRDL